jgi:hypothetical protein
VSENKPGNGPRRKKAPRRYAYSVWIGEDVIEWAKSHDRPAHAIEGVIRASKTFREWKKSREESK